MLHRFTLAVLVSTWVTALPAQTAVTAADFSGTWNIEVMSHQIALVIEPTDATHVNATMMVMGRDTLLKGELVGRTLTLVGDKAAADAARAASPDAAGTPAQGHGPGAAPAKPIVVTLQDDGTIAGEMMTTQGPAKWTGERLKKRK